VVECQLPNRAFIARQVVQVTLPHADPVDIPVWKRSNGYLNLSIRPGWDHENNRIRGYPYGTLPRLLLFWMTTEDGGQQQNEKALVGDDVLAVAQRGCWRRCARPSRRCRSGCISSDPPGLRSWFSVEELGEPTGTAQARPARGRSGPAGSGVAGGPSAGGAPGPRDGVVK